MQDVAKRLLPTSTSNPRTCPPPLLELLRLPDMPAAIAACPSCVEWRATLKLLLNVELCSMLPSDPDTASTAIDAWQLAQLASAYGAERLSASLYEKLMTHAQAAGQDDAYLALLAAFFRAGYPAPDAARATFRALVHQGDKPGPAAVLSAATDGVPVMRQGEILNGLIVASGEAGAGEWALMAARHARSAGISITPQSCSALLEAFPPAVIDPAAFKRAARMREPEPSGAEASEIALCQLFRPWTQQEQQGQKQQPGPGGDVVRKQVMELTQQAHSVVAHWLAVRGEEGESEPNSMPPLPLSLCLSLALDLEPTVKMAQRLLSRSLPLPAGVLLTLLKLASQMQWKGLSQLSLARLGEVSPEQQVQALAGGGAACLAGMLLADFTGGKDGLADLAVFLRTFESRSTSSGDELHPGPQRLDQMGSLMSQSEWHTLLTGTLDKCDTAAGESVMQRDLQEVAAMAVAGAAAVAVAAGPGGADGVKGGCAELEEKLWLVCEVGAGRGLEETLWLVREVRGGRGVMWLTPLL